MSEEPILSLQEAKDTVKGKPYPKVTEESIKEKISHTVYHNEGTTTIAIIFMKNGFRFVGTSTPAHENNYDANVGQRYAYENAFKQIWTHEGYLLRQSLHEREVRGE